MLYIRKEAESGTMEVTIMKNHDSVHFIKNNPVRLFLKDILLKQSYSLPPISKTPLSISPSNLPAKFITIIHQAEPIWFYRLRRRPFSRFNQNPYNIKSIILRFLKNSLFLQTYNLQ